MMTQKTEQGKITLLVTNTSMSLMVIRIEPWSEEFQLESGKRLEFAFIGPGDSVVEFEIGTQTVTIYGWRGSTFSVSAS